MRMNSLFKFFNCNISTVKYESEKKRRCWTFFIS